MLSLKPTARANDAITMLRNASSEATDLLKVSPETLLGAYRKWSNEHSLRIGELVASEELSRVVATPRYWSLHGIDVGGFSVATLSEYIRQELGERIEFLNREAQTLENEVARWNPSDQYGGRTYPLTAVVLDTNVVLTHHADLESVEWHSFFPDLPVVTPLGLAVPIQVIRELDRMKMANNNNINRGTKNELRKDAGSALRVIERIDDPQMPLELRRRDLSNQSVPPISLLLIADRMPGQPLTDADSEIVDRAVSLLPFANGVYLLSYDAAIVFRARLAGVIARKLTYGWDEQDD